MIMQKPSFSFEIVVAYLSLGIICSSKLTVCLKICSWKTNLFFKQITTIDKYPSIFSHQIEAIVYINHLKKNCFLEGITSIVRNRWPELTKRVEEVAE